MIVPSEECGWCSWYTWIVVGHAAENLKHIEQLATYKTGFSDPWYRHCWVWEISFVDIFLLVLLALFFSGLAYFNFANFVLESSCQQFWTYIVPPVGSVYKHKNLSHEFSIYYPKSFETNFDDHGSSCFFRKFYVETVLIWNWVQVVLQCQPLSSWNQSLILPQNLLIALVLVVVGC